MKALRNRQVQQAVAEIQNRILSEFPEATFDVHEGDDPRAVYIDARTDAESIFDVIDLVADYQSDLLVEKDISIIVVPLPRKPVSV